jgi:putative addiction module killer protein
VGYRVYFGLEKEIMILLFGGNKKAQQKDINKSKEFWQDYLSAKGRKNEKIQKL